MALTVTPIAATEKWSGGASLASGTVNTRLKQIQDYLNAAFDLSAGKILMNGATNSKMTYGLTLSQLGADDEILALKSSDVAHGMTSVGDTDTFAYLAKASGDGGGLLMVGLSEATAGLYLIAAGVTAGTVKSEFGTAMIRLDSRLKTGTTWGASGADANLLAISDGGLSRFIFDAEGSAFADVEWTTYAKHNDLALLRSMEAELLRREHPAKTRRRLALE